MNTKVTSAVVLLFSLFLAGTASAFPTYSDIYVFGDSLSDTDVNKDGTNVRGSNGLLWVEYLAPQLGLTYNSANNYAQYGATTGDILGQVLAYNSLVPTYSDALYVVWGGPNDLFDAFEAAFAVDPYNPDQTIVETAIATAAGNIATSVASLATAGAGTIVVPNMPNLGGTPAAFFLDEFLATHFGYDPLAVVGLAQTVSSDFNMALDMALAGLDYQSMDTFTLMENIASDPDYYDFTNVTDPCISDPTGFEAAPFFSDCTGYLFFDFIHPTTQGHNLFSNAMYSTLTSVGVPEPATIALMGIGLLGLGFVHQRKYA